MSRVNPSVDRRESCNQIFTWIEQQEGRVRSFTEGIPFSDPGLGWRKRSKDEKLDRCYYSTWHQHTMSSLTLWKSSSRHWWSHQSSTQKQLPSVRSSIASFLAEWIFNQFHLARLLTILFSLVQWLLMHSASFLLRVVCLLITVFKHSPCELQIDQDVLIRKGFPSSRCHSDSLHNLDCSIEMSNHLDIEKTFTGEDIDICHGNHRHPSTDGKVSTGGSMMQSIDKRINEYREEREREKAIREQLSLFDQLDTLSRRSSIVVGLHLHICIASSSFLSFDYIDRLLDVSTFSEH